jgi:hypothetical protein
MNKYAKPANATVAANTTSAAPVKPADPAAKPAESAVAPKVEAPAAAAAVPASSQVPVPQAAPADETKKK